MAVQGFTVDWFCLRDTRQNLAYNADKRTFYSTSDEVDDAQVAEALKTHLLAFNQTGGPVTPQVRKLHETAGIFLDRQCKLHHAELSKGLSGCKSSPHLMNLEMIDRLVVAITLQQLQPDQINALTIDRIRRSYKTALANEQIHKWVMEPTHRAMKEAARGKIIKHREHINEGVVRDPVQNAIAFALHPAQVKFIKEHRLEKYVGARDGELRVDANTKDYMILADGNYTSIAAISQNHTSERNRLYRQVDAVRRRVFYKDGVGLTACDGTATQKEDPEYFQATVPLFKTKADRKHKDYRLEIWTVIKTDEGDQHTHGWIGLKHPNGEVRHVGFFRREGEEMPWGSLTTTSVGDFHGDGDRYDFMRLEPYTKRTSIEIDQGMYERGIDYILRRQNDEPHRHFNVINQNCTNMVNGVLQEVLGWQLPMDSSLLDIGCGIDLKNNLLIKYCPPVRVFAFVVCAALSILRNIIIVCLGGTFTGDEDKRVFNNILEVFNPYAGRASHPLMLRRWQEKVEKLREEQIVRMTKSDARIEGQMADVIEDRFLSREVEIHRIKTSIPQEAIPRQRSFWWRLCDFFWSLSDDESVVPVP